MGPTRNAKWGKDYKTLTINLSVEEHKAMRIKSIEYGVSAGEVARLAFIDSAMWKRAARAKAQELKAKGE